MALDMINQYAPEHFIICSENEDFSLMESLMLVRFLLEITHQKVLEIMHQEPIIPCQPMDFSRAYSGVNLDSFLKSITFQKISKEGLLKHRKYHRIDGRSRRITST